MKHILVFAAAAASAVSLRADGPQYELVTLLPFPVKVKVRIAHAADSPSGSSCAMLRSTISRITVSASTCSKAARE